MFKLYYANMQQHGIIKMKTSAVLIVLTATLALTACTGPGEIWEPKTYGIRNSKWSLMSGDQQYAAEQLFHENQRLAEQRKMDELKLKQNKAYSKKLHKNENAQKDRLNEEIKHLKQREKSISIKQENLSDSIITQEPQ